MVRPLASKARRAAPPVAGLLLSLLAGCIISFPDHDEDAGSGGGMMTAGATSSAANGGSTSSTVTGAGGGGGTSSSSTSTAGGGGETASSGGAAGGSRGDGGSGGGTGAGSGAGGADPLPCGDEGGDPPVLVLGTGPTSVLLAERCGDGRWYYETIEATAPSAPGLTATGPDGALGLFSEGGRLKRVLWSDHAWTTVGFVSTVEADDEGVPSLVLDEGGTVHATFQNPAKEHQYLAYDGSFLLPERPISGAPVGGHFPAAIAMGTDAPVIAWVGDDGNGNVEEPDGVDWLASEPIDLDDRAIYPVAIAHLEAGPADLLMVAYLEDSGFLWKRRIGGTWSALEFIEGDISDGWPILIPTAGGALLVPTELLIGKTMAFDAVSGEWTQGFSVESNASCTGVPQLAGARGVGGAKAELMKACGADLSYFHFIDDVWRRDFPFEWELGIEKVAIATLPP